MNKNVILGLGAIGGAIYLATSKKAQAKVKKTTGLSDKTITLNSKIKDWYIKEFPTDDMGEDIKSSVTFQKLYTSLGKVDIYKALGVDDSLVRERIFEKLSKLKKVKYDTIYKKWLG